MDGRGCAGTTGTRATSQLLMLPSRLINDLIPFHPLQQRCTIPNTMSSFRLPLIISQHGLLLLSKGEYRGESLHNGLIHSSSKDEWISQGVYYVRKWGRQGWNNFSPYFAWENNAAGCHVLAAIAQQTHQFLWWLCLMEIFDSSLSAELRYFVWPRSTRRVLRKDIHLHLDDVISRLEQKA